MDIIKRLKKFYLYKCNKCYISYLLKLTSILGYPKSASVEITNLCNLECPACETNSISKRKKGSMSFDNFCNILDEIGPHLRYLEISGWGEAFMNKDIYDMLSYARIRARRAYIYLDTNGHFLDAERLILAKLDELVFCIDGLDQKTYEKYRINGRFDTVINNISSSVKARKRLNMRRPRIVIKFICMRHNEHQLPNLPEFSQEIGADSCRIEPFTSRSAKDAVDFMPTISRYQKYDVDNLNKGILSPFHKQLKAPCSMPWLHATIYWNGDVVSCCTDYDALFNWGNIIEKGSFLKVWNGERARGFRLRHLNPSYRSNISTCRDCYLTNLRYKDFK